MKLIIEVDVHKLIDQDYCRRTRYFSHDLYTKVVAALKLQGVTVGEQDFTNGGGRVILDEKGEKCGHIGFA